MLYDSWISTTHKIAIEARVALRKNPCLGKWTFLSWFSQIAVIFVIFTNSSSFQNVISFSFILPTSVVSPFDWRKTGFTASTSKHSADNFQVILSATGGTILKKNGSISSHSVAKKVHRKHYWERFVACTRPLSQQYALINWYNIVSITYYPSFLFRPRHMSGCSKNNRSLIIVVEESRWAK